MLPCFLCSKRCMVPKSRSLLPALSQKASAFRHERWDSSVLPENMITGTAGLIDLIVAATVSPFMPGIS